MFEPEQTEIEICCDRNQVATLNKQYSAPDLLFDRCPSCSRNYHMIFCEVMFCHF